MKISLMILMLIPGVAFAELKKELTIEMKVPSSCLEVRQLLAKEALVVDCESSKKGKVKFFSAGYVGKKNISLYMTELRKKKQIKSVEFDGVIEKLNEN